MAFWYCCISGVPDDPGNALALRLACPSEADVRIVLRTLCSIGSFSRIISPDAASPEFSLRMLRTFATLVTGAPVEV